MGNELKKKIDGYVGDTLINIIGIFLKKKPLSSAGNIPKNPKRILLIKLWGIGNLVMLTPAIKALRKKFPNSKIYFLTLSKNRGLLENVDYVDKVLYYELGPLDAVRIANLISSYHKKFDIVIDFEQFLNISSIIAYFLGKYRMGFSNKTRARHKLYNSVRPCSTNSHMVEQFYDLCRDIGLPKKELKLEGFDFIDKSERVDSFLRKKMIAIDMSEIGTRKLHASAGNEGPISEHAQKHAPSFSSGSVFDKNRKKMIGVHIGSSENVEVKKWPKSYFIELINLLNRKLDNLVFVMTGIGSEKNYIDPVIKKIDKQNCYNSCGVFNLKDFIFFAKKCDLFISNDTGPIHVASACGVYCVGFYGPTSPVLYRPYGENHIVFYKKTRCSPCVNNYSAKSTNCRDPVCMKKIKPNEVADKIISCIKNIKNEK